jgi:hypothetical protein
MESDWITAILAGVVSVASTVGTAVGTAATAVGGALGSAATAVGGALGSVGSAIGSAASSAWGGITGLFGGAGGAAGGAAGGGAAPVAGMTGAAGQSVAVPVTGLAGGGAPGAMPAASGLSVGELAQMGSQVSQGGGGGSSSADEQVFGALSNAQGPIGRPQAVTNLEQTGLITNMSFEPSSDDPGMISNPTAYDRLSDGLRSVSRFMQPDEPGGQLSQTLSDIGGGGEQQQQRAPNPSMSSGIVPASISAPLNPSQLHEGIMADISSGSARRQNVGGLGLGSGLASL